MEHRSVPNWDNSEGVNNGIHTMVSKIRGYSSGKGGSREKNAIFRV
jgi:hypothetical protein